MRFQLAAAVALVATTLSASALADETREYTESKNTDGQVVVFKDNPLDGTTLDPNGAILQGTHRAQRMSFTRPRLNFVMELYKSIEKM